MQLVATGAPFIVVTQVSLHGIKSKINKKSNIKSKKCLPHFHTKGYLLDLHTRLPVWICQKQKHKHCVFLYPSGICPEPGGIPFSNRTIYYGPYNPGYHVTYTCHKGGGGTISCQSNGNWTQKPTCSGQLHFCCFFCVCVLWSHSKERHQMEALFDSFLPGGNSVRFCCILYLKENRKIGPGTSRWFEQFWSISMTSEHNSKHSLHSSSLICIYFQKKNSKLDLHHDINSCFSWNYNDMVCLCLAIPKHMYSYLAKQPHQIYRFGTKCSAMIIYSWEAFLLFSYSSKLSNNKVFVPMVFYFNLLCLQNKATGKTFKATKVYC